MSRIHFIGGEKGGVGKSVLARLLAQYHIDRELPFHAFDTDRSHGALLRFYAAYSDPIDLTDYSSTDRIIEAAVETPRDILVDLAAQSSQPLSRWMDDNDLLELAAEEDIGVVLWHVMDDGADGIALLQRLIEDQGDRLDYVVVKNFGRGNDFSAFEFSQTRAAAVELGAEIIELPELHAPTMRKVDHWNLSFWAASTNTTAGLGLMERQRVRVWMRRSFARFDGLGKGMFTMPVPPLVMGDNVQVDEPAA